MNRFAREAIRKFGNDPRAIARRLGMDEAVLSNGMSAEKARQQLIDLIDDLDDDALIQFGEELQQVAGDAKSRGLRRAAADARERAGADSILKTGLDRHQRATADSIRARAADARREAADARMRGDHRRADDAERRAVDAEAELGTTRAAELGHETAQDRRRKGMAGDSALVSSSFDAMFGEHASSITSMGQRRR